jgi:hypothetical protein
MLITLLLICLLALVSADWIPFLIDSRNEIVDPTDHRFDEVFGYSLADKYACQLESLGRNVTWKQHSCSSTTIYNLTESTPMAYLIDRVLEHHLPTSLDAVYSNQLESIQAAIHNSQEHKSIHTKWGLKVKMGWIPNIAYDVSLVDSFFSQPCSNCSFDGFIYHHFIQVCGPLYKRLAYRPLNSFLPAPDASTCRRLIYFETCKRWMLAMSSLNLEWSLFMVTDKSKWDPLVWKRKAERVYGFVANVADRLDQIADCHDSTGRYYRMYPGTLQMLSAASIIAQKPFALSDLKSSAHIALEHQEYCQFALGNHLIFPSAWRQVSRFKKTQTALFAQLIQEALFLEYEARLKNRLLMFRFTRSLPDGPIIFNKQGQEIFKLSSLSRSLFSGLLFDGSPLKQVC